MKKTKPKPTWLGQAAIILALTLNTVVHAQSTVCNNYDFTTVGSWSQVGTTVAVNTTTGKLPATSSACGGAQQYAYATLGTALDDDSWTCDFDFTVTGNSGPAHSLVSFTEGSGASVVSAHGYWTGSTFNYNKTHCIEAYISAPFGNTNPTNWSLCAHAKERTGGAYGSTTTTPISWSSSACILLGSGWSGATFYARLQRLDATHGMISMYSDAARTVLIGKDCFSISAGITGLTSVQSGTHTEGSAGRVFSGTVDNIKACNLYPVLSGTPSFCASASAKTYTMWNGNPNVTSDNCGFPGATSFTWSAPAGSSFPSGTGGSFGSGSSGVYNLCSIDVNTTGTVTCVIEYCPGVLITYTFSVTVNPSPSAALSVPASFCAGAAITANGAGSMYGTSHRWGVIEVTDITGSTIAPGATWCQQPAFVSGSPGSVNLASTLACASFTCGKYYKVRLEVKNGCATSTVYDVFYLACLPTVAINGASAICPGSCATLVAAGASTYAWSPSTGLSCPTCASTSACPTSTQVYTVIGTSSYGCTDSESATVTVYSAPSVALGADQLLCCNQSYTFAPVVTGGTSPYTYVWTSTPSGVITCSHSGAHSPATACPAPKVTWDCLPSGSRTYSVTVTDANGCTGNDGLLITTTSPCRLAQNPIDDPASATSVYPNPATKQITVNTTVVPDQIFITDALGRTVMSVQTVAEQTQIDLSGLSPGVYFVNILIAESVETQQLIIQE